MEISIEDLLDRDVYSEDQSYQGEHRVSILDYSTQSEQPNKVNIRVSERNQIIRKKLSMPQRYIFSEDQPITASCIERMEQEHLEKLKELQRVKSPEVGSKKHYKVYSCFLLYILGENGFRSGIAETELRNYRKIFTQMLRKAENCHEAYFGLGKLYAYTSQFSESVQNLKKAVELFPNDQLYTIWLETIANYMVLDSKESLLTQRDVLNRKNHIEIIKKLPRIEYLWCLLINSIKCVRDTKTARRIASRIKKQDDYYGYLAWCEVFFIENSEERAVMVLKEMTTNEGGRPEAYYKLWRYYYDNKKYRESELIAANAFVKVTDLAFNHYFIIFCICYAKSYVQTGKVRGALELLQQKYIEHRKHSIFLYHYGRFCIKTEDEAYLICGITALEECIRVCDLSLHGKVYFWLGKAYLIQDYLLKSHKTFTTSLKLLNPADKKKITEIHTVLGRSNSVITKLKQLENLKSPLSTEDLAQRISETHPVEAVIAYGKALWNQSREGALEFLLAYRSEIYRCDFFFAMFSYAKKLKNFRVLKAQAKRLIERCKDLRISTSDWILCHIWYAKALVCTDKPEKAIFLLKCMGKVFPDIPYMDLKYTKVLSSAETVADLLDARYTNQVFRQSVHIVSNVYLNALASRDVPLFLQEKRDQAQIIYAADSVIDSEYDPSRQGSTIIIDEKAPGRQILHRYKEKIPKGSEFNKLSSQKLENLLQKRERIGFIGFSLCSDPEFLYCIGKFAMKFEVETEDGLLAIEDFLELTEDETERAKGIYIKSMLFLQKSQPSEYLPLMQDLLHLLTRCGLTERANKIKAILDSR